MMNYQVLILAAGNGSRMASGLPKVMHEVGGRPMIEMVLSNVCSVTNDIILVYSHQLYPYLTPYKELCKFVLQSQILGTAHAVYCALELISKETPVGVVYGDNPFISSSVIKDLFDQLQSTGSAVATLSFNRSEPGQYGRIITNSAGEFIRIVEFKDASPEERKVTLCNSGVMAFAPGILQKYLPYCVSAMKEQSGVILN